ncbi:radical SAM domain protein [Candidatus Vecturithrix granuli]|uniref:Radical SAM domain protein n=1 Tax=Vecturithrix granuli TaxID=1499967 RepID=A0A081BW73_VECG1|nr:radical SAM domain protein [Candidatus Vecturithrix granuli]
MRLVSYCNKSIKRAFHLIFSTWLAVGKHSTCRNSEDWQVSVVHHNIPYCLLAVSHWLLGIRLKNTGKQSWHTNHDVKMPVNVAFYCDGVFIGNGETIEEEVLPDKSMTVFFKFVAPCEIGAHTLTIRMAVHNVRFIELTAEGPLVIPIRVAEDLPWSKRHYGSYRLFIWQYLSVTMWLLQVRWYLCRFAFLSMRRNRNIRRRLLKHWRATNRSLALLERFTNKAKVSAYPRDIILDCANLCNLKCVSCFRQYLGRDLNQCPSMDDQTLEKAIAELFPTAENVNISLVGEPLLSPYLSRIINALEEYDVALSLTTNGTLLQSDTLCRRLVKVLGYLEVSIDSSDPLLFAQLRPGAKLVQVLAGFRQINRIRDEMHSAAFKLAISMTLFSINIHEVSNMIQLAADIGADFLRVSFGIVFREEDWPMSVVNCPNIYNEVFHQAHAKARDCGIALSMPLPFEELAPVDNYIVGACRYLYDVARINYEGNCVPCLNPGAPFVINFSNSSFKSFWNCFAMQKLRMDHKTENAPAVCKVCYVINNGNNTIAYRRRQLFVPGDSLRCPDRSGCCDQFQEERP